MPPPRAAVALSLLLAVAGCTGLWTAPPSDPGAEAVVQDAAARGASVDTFRAESELRVVATGEGGRQRVDVSVEGVVDRRARRWRQTTTTDDANRTVYVVGNTTYTECPAPWDGWGVEQHDELDDAWRATDPLGRQLELLADSPVTWVGNETVDGRAVHVVEARPTGRTLRQFEDGRPVFDPFGPNVENATVTAWITTDRARLLRTDVTFAVASRDGRADASMTTTFSDYGVDATVVLPDSTRTDRFELGCPAG